MDHQRLEAYVNLIEALLQCEPGQEPALLGTHQDLLDAGLIPVLEQAARQLMDGEQGDGAAYLISLAIQLQGTLVKAGHLPNPEGNDRAEAYLKLIDALLCCPSGLEPQILGVNQHLVDQGLVAMMEEVAEGMAQSGDQEAAEFLRGGVEQVSQLLAGATQFVQTLNET